MIDGPWHERRSRSSFASRGEVAIAARLQCDFDTDILAAPTRRPPSSSQIARHSMNEESFDLRGTAERATHVRYAVLVAACTVAIVTYIHRIGFAVGGPEIMRDLN